MLKVFQMIINAHLKGRGRGWMGFYNEYWNYVFKFYNMLEMCEFFENLAFMRNWESVSQFEQNF